MTVSVSTTGLAAGSYSGSIAVSAPGVATANVPVTFTVSAQPTITAVCTPAALSFAFTIGGSAPAVESCTLSSAPSGLSLTATLSTTAGGNWLAASLTVATTPATLTVSVIPAGLAAGSYSGSIGVSAPGAATVNLPVTFAVTPPPTLSSNCGSLSFAYNPSGPGPSPQTCSITSNPTGLGVTAAATTTSGGAWLSVSPNPMTSPATLTVSLNPSGLASGTYAGNVALSVPAAPIVNIAVSLTVSSQPTLAIGCTPNPLSFSYIIGGTAPAAVCTMSTSPSGLSLTATPSTVSGGNWLTALVSPNTSPSTLSVSINTAGLAAGNYSGNIAVSATGATPINLPVTLAVAAATVTLNPTAATPGAAGGSGMIAVTASSSTAAWQAFSNVSWITILSGSSGTGNGTVTYQVNANNSTSALVGTLTVAGLTFTVTQAGAGGGTSGLAFYPVTPCRLVDTRNASGPTGGPAMGAGSTRNFPILSGSCGIPPSAQVYSFNVTVAPPAPLGYLTIWPAGLAQPFVSTLNSSNGAVVANAAMVPAGTGGVVSVYASDATDVIIDINGYFAPPQAGALAFYPITPCRVVDTRSGQGTSGLFGPPQMAGGETRSFPVSSSPCGVPSSAQAYSVNMTVVPPGPMQYLSTWPAGLSQPVVSTLNAYNGQVAANAATVPAGVGGAIDVFVTDPTDLVIDINGYFAQGGMPGAQYFYPVMPCRIADTRNATGPFGGPELVGGTTRDFPLPSSACGLPSTAQAYSLNITVVPPGPLGYLAVWPQGFTQPNVSTLNSMNAQIIANAALVPAGINGGISVYVSNSSNVVIDTNGYFGQ